MQAPVVHNLARDNLGKKTGFVGCRIGHCGIRVHGVSRAALVSDSCGSQSVNGRPQRAAFLSSAIVASCVVQLAAGHRVRRIAWLVSWRLPKGDGGIIGRGCDNSQGYVACALNRPLCESAASDDPRTRIAALGYLGPAHA